MAGGNGLTVGSLFSGIGGLDLGLERAGFEIKFQVEIDDYCNKVLEKHWPDVVRFQDVRECGRQNLEPVDLVCGGFPCQDVSLTGKRAGLAGKQTTLWSEFARIIGELGPQWVLAENVPGLLSSDAGRFFGAVLRDLAACGYDAEWDCLPAAAFGAPHRRDRVWIVAHAAQQYGTIIGRQAFEPGRGGKTLADTSGSRAMRLSVRPGRSQQASLVPVGRCEDVAYSEHEGLERKSWSRIFNTSEFTSFCEASRRFWSTEPDVGRVAHGIPRRVDRLRGLGNAVVPQVAEWIGKRIAEAENA